MSKKPQKAKKKTRSSPSSSSSSIAKPQAGQINAIQRLLDAKRFAEAATQARALIRQFPEHGAPRRALIEALEGQRNPSGAALAAYEWAALRPNSPQAQQALFDACLQTRSIFLLLRTTRRLQALGVGSGISPPVNEDMLDELLTMPDGQRATQAQMEHFEAARFYVNAQQFEAALDLLKEAQLLPERNNQGVCLYHLGRIDEALACFEASWRDDPDNLFALGWMLRLRLYRGDEDGAHGLATPLAASRARRSEDARIQLDVLLLIGEDEAVRTAFAVIRDSDWFGNGDALEHAWMYHYAAGAACRLGEFDEARALWRQALAERPMPIIQHNLDTLAQRTAATPVYPSLFDLSGALPLDWLKRFQADTSDNQLSDEAFSHYISEVSAANAFLKRLYLYGDKSIRGLAIILLRMRTKDKDNEAAALLKAFAALPIETSQQRFEYLSLLHEQGYLNPREAVDFWSDHGLTQVKLFHQSVHRDPVDSGLPPELNGLAPRT
jgi:tetratricopeptide (TPR) repeat protein